MPAESAGTTVDVTTEAAPGKEAEQSKEQSTGLAAEIIKAASEIGMSYGDPTQQPKAEVEPEPEPEPEPEFTGTEPEPEPDEPEEPVAAEYPDHDISPKGSIAEKLEWYKEQGKQPPWYF